MEERYRKAAQASPHIRWPIQAGKNQWHLESSRGPAGALEEIGNAHIARRAVPKVKVDVIAIRDDESVGRIHEHRDRDAAVQIQIRGYRAEDSIRRNDATREPTIGVRDVHGDRARRCPRRKPEQE